MAGKQDTLTIEELKKATETVFKRNQNKQNLNKRNQNAASSSISKEIGCSGKKVFHYLAVLGMSSQELAEADPAIFGAHYKEVFFRKKRCLILNGDIAKDIYELIKTYGYLAIKNTLEIGSPEVLEKELSKFGFEIDLRLFGFSNAPGVYESKFYRAVNKTLRKAIPNLPDFTKHLKAATSVLPKPIAPSLTLFTQVVPERVIVIDEINQDAITNLTQLLQALIKLPLNNANLVESWLRAMNKIISSYFINTDPAAFKTQMESLIKDLAISSDTLKILDELVITHRNIPTLEILWVAQLEKNKQRVIQTTTTSTKRDREKIDKKPFTIKNLHLLLQDASAPPKITADYLLKHLDCTREDIISAFCYLGMNAQELRLCDPRIFGNDYEKTLSGIPIYHSIQLNQTPRVQQLIYKYGSSKVGNALGTNTCILKYLNDEFNRFGISIFETQKPTAPKKINIETTTDFFSDMNALIRECNPWLPNYREFARNPVMSEHLPNYSGAIEGLTPLDNFAFEREDTDTMNPAKKQKRSPSPTFFTESEFILSDVEQSNMLLDLSMLEADLNKLNVEDIIKRKEWIDELDTIFSSYLDGKKPETYSAYLDALTTSMPTLSEDNFQKLQILSQLYPKNQFLTLLFTKQVDNKQGNIIYNPTKS